MMEQNVSGCVVCGGQGYLLGGGGGGGDAP